MKTSRLTLALVWALAACSSSPSGSGKGPSLVSITTEPPGANCAAGGQRVQTGFDTNGNGKLDPSEVTGTNYVCNGTNGAVTLTATTTLAAGDTHCAAGGVQIDSGLDTNGNGTLDSAEITSTTYVCNGADGSGGSAGQTSLTATTTLAAGDSHCADGGAQIDSGVDTNGNGTLDPAEITSTQYVCNGPSASGAKPIDPPLSQAGATTYSIDSNGGAGTAGAGGQGGSFAERFTSGTLGGHAKVFATGQADASFTFPTSVATDLGDNPVTVSSDTDVLDYSGSEPTTPGEVHTHPGDDTLYVWDGTKDVPVTGVSIAAGKTLTLEPNVSGGTAAQISLPNDVDNAGTLTTGMVAGSHASLTLTVGTYYGEADSSVALGGTSPSDTSLAGGAGGTLQLDTNAVFNAGDIDTSGGDGAAGGAGGSITLLVTVGLDSTGTLQSTGGTGLSDVGGTGGDVFLGTESGHVWASGTIITSGGDGATAGGSAGAITMSFDSSGECLNRATLTANGGNVTDAACDSSAQPCTGGRAGNIELDSGGAKLISSGAMSATGGSGTTGAGRDGGSITFTTAFATGVGGAVLAAGDIRVSGNLSTGGGGGTSGGNGGSILAQSTDDQGAHGQEIIFYGFTDMQLDGGDGTNGGGNAGSFTLDNSTAANVNGVMGPSGGAINYANVSAHGGAGGSQEGGHGGSIELRTENQYGYQSTGEVALNYGDIDVRGGDGFGGGAGGSFTCFGDNRAENHGTLQLGGGGTGTNGGAGAAAVIESGVGAVLNSGSIDTSGGSGNGDTSAGGDGADITLLGVTQATNSGDLTTAGGNTDRGNGGNAGTITISATNGPASNSGAITITGGTGAYQGAVGQVWVGGENMTSSFLP